MPDPTTPEPARPPETDRSTRASSALAWAQLALCAASVICGVFIGLNYSEGLGETLAGAGLGGASIRIIINVRR
ncbi:hypothetical protein AQJ11_03120 [Streptomyces corchorusii]|uniref:Uncharacterized protein n=1 Tax=Streptomyces corchorusii TaxID=1903 RepID=A0A117QJY9_STRCK|nr:hypothetical protein AQJ11_03120 [Streptomyces corchorusii]